jgi:hypothetical protein
MRRADASPTSIVVSIRFLGTALLASAALLAVGCGGGSGDPATRVGGEPISFQQLSQSASTSAAATSGRFSFDVSMSFPGSDDPFALSGEGAFDQASERASFAVDMSSFATLLGGFLAGLGGSNAPDMPDFDDPAGWQIEVVRDGDVGYVRFPALDDQLPEGKSWIRAKEGEKAGGFELEQFDQFAQSDPRELLESLRAVTSDVEVVGTESLRGTEVTHYRAVIEPKDLAAKAPAGQREQTESLVDEITSQSGLEAVPVDVWIDATGLVRKLAMTFSATDPASSHKSEASMAFELWDYNEPVEIDLPPASEVVDASAVRG